MPAKARFQVLISDAYQDRIEEVAARIRAAGLDVKDIQKAIGVLIVDIDPDRLPELSSVEGVEETGLSRMVRALSPDPDIQ